MFPPFLRSLLPCHPHPHPHIHPASIFNNLITQEWRTPGRQAGWPAGRWLLSRFRLRPSVGALLRTSDAIGRMAGSLLLLPFAAPYLIPDTCQPSPGDHLAASIIMHRRGVHPHRAAAAAAAASRLVGSDSR